MPKKTTKKSAKPRSVYPKKVTRAFLLDLANRIYDPKTKKFLHLCTGTLQNGPDPTNEKRAMHCGLGELYFAITGREPKKDLNVYGARISESDVIDLAVNQSPLKGGTERHKDISADSLSRHIDTLKISESLKDTLQSITRDEIESSEDDEILSPVQAFVSALGDIPSENDDDPCGHTAETCSPTEFKARSRRVSAQLRKAAKLLPPTKTKARTKAK